MITIYRTVNLNQLCRVENLSGVVFTGEQGGHEFILTAIKDEAVTPLTGSVSGQVRCPDGTAVQLTTAYCDIDEYGRGVVKLAGNCYEHGSGPFGLIVTNVDGNGNRTVIYAAAGFINTGEAASPVDPENTINVAEIQAYIADMESATDDALAAAAFVPNLISAEYNYLSTYGVGDYCTHEGYLYRCVVPITTAGSAWGVVSGNFQKVDVAGEMFGLTNAFNEMYAADVTNTNSWTVGSLKAADGTALTSTTGLRMNSFVNVEDEVFRIKAKDGYEFLVYAWNKTSGSYIGCLKTGGVFNPETTGYLWLKEYNIANSPALKFKVVMRNAASVGATITVAEAVNCLYTTRYVNDDAIAPEFDATATYAAGDYVLYETECYRFTAAHTGAWTGADAVKKSVGTGIAETKMGIEANIAAAFDASHAYKMGDHVLSDGALYRLTADHDEGTSWENTSKSRVSVFDSCYTFGGSLTSSTDLNTLLNVKKFYRWTSNNIPVNAPNSSYGGAMICLGSNGVYYQIVITARPVMYFRSYSSSTWSSWKQIAVSADVETLAGTVGTLSADLDDVETTVGNVTETVETDSIAAITGDAGDSYTITGITLTKVSDNEFTMTGNTTSNSGKGFNYLLGASQSVTNAATVMNKNISEPGTYTLAFVTSGATLDDYDHLFAITDSTYKLRKYLKNGDSFTVENDPVCLFVYGTTTMRLLTNTLTVKWALYKGEEYKGFPYTDDGEITTGIDYVARNRTREENRHAIVAEYVSWGKANTLANARHIMNLRWTPLKTMPKSGGTYEAGVEIMGIPYSSVRDSDKAVGMNVSIHTFMTALHDPNSVLYTRKSNTTNATTYYGTVCSGLCNYAYGIGLNLTNTFLGECDMFEDVPRQDIQIGDMLAKDGHVAMVKDVTKDEYGRVKTVTVIEEWAPNTRTRYFSSYEKFADEMAVYKARRFKKLSGVEYTPIPYVQCFDEDEVEIVYPDVQTDHGDAAVFAAGEDVRINVIDAKDFETITVKKGSTTVRTTSSISPFVMEGLQPGLYTVEATGVQHSSVSTFYVVDTNGSFDVSTGVVTFSSSNATPVLINVYAIGSPDETGRLPVSCKPVILTDADRLAGSKNVSAYVDQTYCNAKVTFSTPYGTADWYSETHERWVPIE